MSGEAAPPPPAPVASTVTVSPASATLTSLEETAPLTAEVRDQYGVVMPGAVVAWGTSGVERGRIQSCGCW